MILNRIMNAIKALKEDTADTGWIDCELEDGITGATAGYGGPAGIQYRQIGKVVYVRGSISATYDGSNSLLLTTLPYTQDYRTYVFDVLTGSRIARLYINVKRTIISRVDKGTIRW